MSPQKIKSPSGQPQDLKSRVVSCLNKLSDRETLAIGASELESIVQTRTLDTFSPFLTCIHNIDDSSKSPVRRQCVHILALLTHSHGDNLSPHVSKNPSPSVSSRLEKKNGSSRKIEVVRPQSTKHLSQHDERGIDSGVLESGWNQNEGNSRPETKRALFGKITDERLHNFGALKSGSRVVPFSDPEEFESVPGVLTREASDEDYDNEKEMQDLTMVRKQLAQIENQQSSLFELLQKFIGNSRSGMNALETRVQGVEMALEEISIDFGLSSGRFPYGDSSDSKCCMLPGADFLSSKFWRKAEGRYSSLRLSSQGSIQIGNETINLGKERFQNRKTDAFTEKREVGDYSSRSLRVLRDGDRVQFISSNGLDGTSPAASLAFGSLTSRSSS